MTDTNDDRSGRRPRGPTRAPENRPARALAEEAGRAGDADRDARILPAEDRIAKVIARAGIASRRDAEAMIEAGRVTLNGTLLASPAVNVGPADRITVDGEPLPLRERTRLWLFHKPRGLVTTARDPQGRPTVFESLPEEMPRVVAIGRLDINTEGLLLLTNDGGLAKVIAHPETGWTRRYRVRAHGEVTQEQLDTLRDGVTIDDISYGAIEARLDRVQGDNYWITLALREGKNREVKRVLEHLGLRVNRLLRLSFGPFQLGDLEPGLAEEVRTRVLKDQLGDALATEAGVDFESPVREPIAPFGSERRRDAAEGRDRPPRPAGREAPRPRRASPDGERFGGVGPRPPRDREERRPSHWRSEGDEERPRRFAPRADPKAERAASAARPRERVGAIEARGGRVQVERVKRAETEPVRDRGGERPPRRREEGGGERRPPRAERPLDGGAGKRDFGGDKRGFSGEKKSFGGESRGRGEGRGFGGEKRPFSGEKRGFGGGEKRSFGGEKRGFGGGPPGGGRGSPGGPRGFGGPGKPRGGPGGAGGARFGRDASSAGKGRGAGPPGGGGRPPRGRDR